MTTLEIDLSRITCARDLHVAFSAALRFPDWYGHNWDAFWDLVSSDYPLPEQLTIRGLDHVERVLPDEATKMLACFGDYNNDTGRTCAVAVTDDYATPLFFLQYETRPMATADLGDVEGAFVSCWIKAASAHEANLIALREIETAGWAVVRQEDVTPTMLADASDEDREFVAQACVDGIVLDIHAWSSDADDEDNK